MYTNFPTSSSSSNFNNSASASTFSASASKNNGGSRNGVFTVGTRGTTNPISVGQSRAFKTIHNMNVKRVTATTLREQQILQQQSNTSSNTVSFNNISSSTPAIPAMDGSGGTMASKKMEDLPANRFVTNPTPELKLRLVFQEMDTQNNRMITLDGFRRVLKALNIDFTPATADDLFGRMTDQQTYMQEANYSDFLDFAAQYPSLIDAIYERSRAEVERARRELIIESQKSVLEALQQKERVANTSFMEAQKVVIQKDHEVQSLREQVAVCKEERRLCGQLTHDAEKEHEFAKSERNLLQRDVEAAVKAERQALHPVSNAESIMARMQEEVRQMELEVYNRQMREIELQRELDQSKKDTQLLREALGEKQIELRHSEEDRDELIEMHSEHKSSLSEIQQSLREANTVVEKATAEADRVLSQEKQAAATLKNVEAELQIKLKESVPLRHAEDAQREIHRRAVQSMDRADETIRTLEHQQEVFANQHLGSASDEQPLLDNEVRLREQRNNINVRDQTHRDETVRFNAVHERPVSPPRSPQRQRA